MDKYVGERLESVDMFADSGGDHANVEFDTDLDMFNDDDDADLVKALNMTSEVVNAEMQFEEELCPSPPPATPLETLPGFDLSAGRTWIYPCNMSHRTYQFDIVQSCLYSNTLVCLPTGLGKTFIAAVVMYNFYRWYPQGKIVFMAPTKPLVGQQIEACFKIMGIPQEDTKEMTGNVSVSERTKAWASKRVFFLTPQVMSNDLSRGLFPAREVKLLIVDEAHKAQGEYAYCLVARELARAQAMTRIVALSATPGTDIPNVKAMLQNLYISHIELRHEESPDILPYTHSRVVDKIVVPMDKSILEIKEKLLGVMEIYTKKLSAASAVRKGHNPSGYTKYGFISSRDEWRQNPPANLTNHVKGQVEGDFAAAIKLYHGMELLTTQGLRSFYNFFTKEVELDGSSKRIRGELSRIPLWRDILAIVTEKFIDDSSNIGLNQAGPMLSQAGRPVQKTATSHPKMDRLLEVVQEHFVTFSKKGVETRVMIFSQYRDCVNELVACMASLRPTVKAMSFIGQAGAAGKKGLTQKEQIEVVRRFKDGGYNTLVATCVGEEGLDIGEVDLIVLYDVARSPIRLVQRMGRTGRKREGRIVVLVTEGQEEKIYNQSLYSKKNINKAILEKERLEHVLYTQAPRMIPLGMEPVCHRMKMIVGKWKGKYDATNKNGMQGVGIQGFTKKMTKDDIFRLNCGFMTEAEEERWRKDVRFQGKVKMVKAGMELWAGKGGGSDSPSKQTDFFNLGDYSLWQTGEQFRRCVGTSNVSSTYMRLVEMMGNRETIQKRIDDHRKVVNQLEKSQVAFGGEESRTASTGEKNVQGGIMKYFKRSQVTPSKNKVIQVRETKQNTSVLETVKESDVEYIDLDMTDAEQIAISSAAPNAEESMTQTKMILKARETEEVVNVISENIDHNAPKELNLSSETILLNSLFEDQDSGLSSLPYSPPSLKRLIEFPPSVCEVNQFDVLKAINKIKKKLGLEKADMLTEDMKVKDVDIPNELIVMPVNESLDDMFADDSLFGNIDFEKVSEVKKPKDAEDNVDCNQTATFDLESPVVSPAILAPPIDDADSQFDLGSPIITDANNHLDPQDNRNSISPPVITENVKENPQIQQSEMPNLFNRALNKLGRGMPSNNTSTPLPGRLVLPIGPDLTPVHPVSSRPLDTIQESPLLLRSNAEISNQALLEPSTSRRSKPSEDMFGNDSEDEMFLNFVSVAGEGEKSKSKSKSLFSATQLVKMINEDSTDRESISQQHSSIKENQLKSVETRRKLSNLFDEFVEEEKFSIIDEEEKQFQVQMKNAIEASLKKSQAAKPVDEENKGEAVFDLTETEFAEEEENKAEAVFDLSDIEFSQETDKIKVIAKEVSSTEEINSDDVFINNFASHQENVNPPGNTSEVRVTFQSKSSEESINLLKEKQKKKNNSSNFLQPQSVSAPTTDCPVCNRKIAGDINNHLDECLNSEVIDELTQQATTAGGSQTRIVAPVVGIEQKNMPDLVSSSDDDSPLVKKISGWDRSKSRLSEGDSPVAPARKARARVLASQSNLYQSRSNGEESDDSPVGKRAGGRPRMLDSQSFDDRSFVRENSVNVKKIDTPNSHTVVRKKIIKPKRNRSANGFLEVEAEVSDSGGSDDEDDDTEDKYDESFVDDATQATQTAFYLKSVRSPEFRRPKERILPPITEDIFSQAVRPENDDFYAEDSFCVGSQEVEWESGFDTLDILDRRADRRNTTLPAKRKRVESDDSGKNKRRKRIIAPSSDDETVIEIHDNSPEKVDEMDGINLDEFDSSFSESQSLFNCDNPNTTSNSKLLLQPDLSTSISEAEKLSIIVSNSEVNKVPEVISSLRHLHHLSVSIRACDIASFIVSQNCAVHRLNEVEFGTGTMKEKLVQRVRDSMEQYSRTIIIVEWEKVKPGDRPKSGTRTKQLDLLVGQLALSSVVVMYSKGQLETATLLSELVHKENKNGSGLPRPFRLTVWQEEMVKWIQEVPGTSLASAVQLAINFTTLRELITATSSQLIEKGRLDRGTAEGMVNFFSKTFQPELTDIAPL